MRAPLRKKIAVLVIALAVVGYGGLVRAADGTPTVHGGIVAGYGDDVDIYGIQAIWAPHLDWAWLAKTGLEPRLAAQVAQWRGRDAGTDYASLVDVSLIPLLRWPAPTTAGIRPFVEAGLGVHLLSHTRINDDRQLSTAFQFGSHADVGIAFGAQQRWELSGFIHHTSNASIKQPNDGLTYFGVVLRYGMP